MKKRTSILRKLVLLIVGLTGVCFGGYSFYILSKFKSDKEKYIQQVNQFTVESQGRKLQAELQQVRGAFRTLRQALNSTQNIEQRNQISRLILQSQPFIRAFGLVKTKQAAWDDYTKIFEYFIQNSSQRETQKIDMKQVASGLASSVVQFLQNQDSTRAGATSEILLNNNDQNFYVLEFFDKQKEYISVGVVSRELLRSSVELGDFQAMSLIHDRLGVVEKGKKDTDAQNVDEKIYEFANKSRLEVGSQKVLDQHSLAWMGSFFQVGNGFTMISKISEQEAFAARDELVKRSLYFAILIVAAGILIGLIFSNSIVRPLKVLTSASEDIAAGNYQVNIEINSNDEVQDLAESFVTLGRRLTEREQELEKITELAIKDGMTGLYNHRYFKQRLIEFFSLSQRHNTDLSLYLIDVDFFKKFNDTYGHQQGDEVLKSLAKLAKSVSRETDLVARYGGEEFVVILPETNLEGAILHADRMRQAYSEMPITNLKDGSAIKSTCSIGVVSFRNGKFENIDQFIEHADENLYKAKERGRNRVVGDA